MKGSGHINWHLALYSLFLARRMTGTTNFGAIKRCYKQYICLRMSILG